MNPTNKTPKNAINILNNYCQQTSIVKEIGNKHLSDDSTKILLDPTKKPPKNAINIKHNYCHQIGNDKEIYNECLYDDSTKILLNPTKKTPKNTSIFHCEPCKFKCHKLSDYNRHLSTNKHNNNLQNTTPISCKEFLCICGKKYSHSSSMYAHKKNCILKSPPHTNTSSTDNIDHSSLTEKMIELIMSKNQEFMNMFMDKVVHFLPSNTTNNNTNNTTNNNQFNIQMFLNEHCKNAMNISEFIQSLPITAQHYEDTKNNGLTDTLTNLLVNGLNQLEVVERPIHCTDQKRKTMYVKDNDTWEKDPNNQTLLKNIAHLSRLQRTKVQLWQDVNPQFATDEKLQMAFTNIIQSAFTFIEEDNKELNKILKGLTQATFIDDDTKSQFNYNSTV